MENQGDLRDLGREVWKATVDEGRFTSIVRNIDSDPYRGELTVVANETGEELLRQEVPVAFGAPFGPDVSDVWQWQEASIAVIDPWIRARGEEVPTEEGNEEGEHGGSETV
jgi:hypothetical protein